MEGETSVLRWGGLAGILGGLLFILVLVIVFVFVGPAALDPTDEIMWFPDVRAARTVENSLYLAALLLWIPLFVALYRALRGTSPAPALFGSVLGVVGLVVLAAGALVHVATARLSDLYHAPGATPEEQATLFLLWQATMGIFDALLVTGLVIMPIALILLGAAMFKAATFGKGVGSMSVGLGAAGVVAASVLLVDPFSPIAVVSVLGLIVFHLVLGREVYRLSRAPGPG